MELRKIDEGLWTVDELIRLPGGFRLAARTTVVRLSDGGLAVLSPVPGLAAVADAIAALGPVRTIIAPNLMHHLGIDAARARFPEARVFVPPELVRKRPDLAGLAPLGDAPDPLWAGALDQAKIAGMPRLEEVVFFHRASRTLILFDLCFYLRAPEHLGGSRFMQLMMRLNDAWGRFGPSRHARSLMKDRPAVRASIDRLLSWDPARILPAHGDLVESDARAALAGAFAFLRP